MRNIYFMLLSAMLLFVVGCNKEKQNGESLDSDVTVDYVYMDMTMQLPVDTGTRSGTDWDSEDDPGKGNSNSDAVPDTEDGQDYENTVKTVMLVLANSKDEFISYSEVTGSIAKKESAGEYSIKAKFNRSDIEDAYKAGGALAESTTVKIYAYVNYTNNLHKLFSGISENDKKEEWLNWSGEINELPSKAGSSPVISNTIWAQHSFLMTNATEFKATLPDSNADWDQYSDSDHPFIIKTEDSGMIEVERSAARIDFMDASDGDNTYNVWGGLTSDGGDGINLVDVQLTRMSLVNMAKKFYYLRRVSDGFYDEKPRIGKYETRNNYVVDTDWSEKFNGNITPKNAKDYFNFPLYSEDKHDDFEFDHYAYDRSNWYTDNIADVVNRENKVYHIWRYVTENTLPSVESQTTIQSTGVVFKGLILPGEDIGTAVGEDNSHRYISEAVETALIASKNHLPKHGTGLNESNAETWDGTNPDMEGKSYDYPLLYEFESLLYAGFDEVVKYAAFEGQGSLLYSAVQSILEHWTLNGTMFEHKTVIGENDIKLTVRIYNEIRNGFEHVDDGSDDYTEGFTIELTEDEDYFKSYATSAKQSDASSFTIYEASFEDVANENGEGWGYYCYYFYWNRHNDNNLNGKMGPMEFAIVRNNVYKLSVNAVNRLGHPRNPDNDPHPFNPNDPDEESLVYLNVDLKVLPWVVRVNNITF